MPDHASTPENEAAQPSFWQRLTGHAYLEGGYFEMDESTTPATPVLRLEFVSQRTMDAMAQKLGDENLSSTQARRFFNHCRTLESQLITKRLTWRQCQTSLHSMLPIAVSACARGNLPALFRDFIQANVHACQEPRDFTAGFLPHFEALIGFGSKYFNTKN